MANRSYWAIFVDEVMPGMGISVNAEQREELLDAILGHADMEREATGEAVADVNLYGYITRELKSAEADLKYEQEKITCRSCNGKGFTITYGGTLQSRSQCWECHGDGKVHPSKASGETLAY